MPVRTDNNLSLQTFQSYYELLSGEVCDRYELTQMEYDILMFLHNNPQHNTAADIVKIRKSTKSHVSTSLKNLENKGLVERIQSKDNKKHIEIVLCLSQKYILTSFTIVLFRTIIDRLFCYVNHFFLFNSQNLYAILCNDFYVSISDKIRASTERFSLP